MSCCRELSNRLYNFSSYFVAKSVVSLPFQLLFTTAFVILVYFTVGYQVGAQQLIAISHLWLSRPSLYYEAPHALPKYGWIIYVFL